MYSVEHFEQTDRSLLHNYIHGYPFASLVTVSPSGPCVNQLPLEMETSFGRHGRLLGHIARSNPLWQSDFRHPAMAVFCSHQGYVSPDWYESKQSDPRVVPTWNYVTVQVSGRLTFFEDSDRLLELVARLTDRFEANRETPWKTTDAPTDFVQKMLGGIVGVELAIERIEGKWKLSQNRSVEDRAGVRAGLRREADAAGAALADLMEANDESCGA